eukprot:6205021-Pleurochrysis_carterae.AAC.3
MAGDIKAHCDHGEGVGVRGDVTSTLLPLLLPPAPAVADRLRCPGRAASAARWPLTVLVDGAPTISALHESVPNKSSPSCLRSAVRSIPTTYSTLSGTPNVRATELQQPTYNILLTTISLSRMMRASRARGAALRRTARGAAPA